MSVELRESHTIITLDMMLKIAGDDRVYDAAAFLMPMKPAAKSVCEIFAKGCKTCQRAKFIASMEKVMAAFAALTLLEKRKNTDLLGLHVAVDLALGKTHAEYRMDFELNGAPTVLTF